MRYTAAIVKFIVPNIWIILYSLPILVTFWAILTYGVDTLYVDELLYVPRLEKIADGTFTVADVVALHHDHRPAIPFLITAASVFSIGWHAPYKYFLSLMYTGASTLMFCQLLKQNQHSIPNTTKKFLALTICALSFSLLQLSIWVQGMYSSVPLFVLISLAAIAVVANNSMKWSALLFATVLCIAASLTQHQGVLTFFPILFLIWAYPQPSYRRIKFAFVFGVGIITVILYHTNYTGGEFSGDLLYGIKNPLQLIQFILAFWGAPLAPTSLPVATIIGGIFLFASCSLSWALLKGERKTQAAPWISLLLFIFAVSVAAAVGRVWLGPHYALRPRYLAMSYAGTVSLLVLTAIYLQGKIANFKLFHLLLVAILMSNTIFGVMSLPKWREKSLELQAGKQCFKTYQTASPQCLSYLGSDQISSDEVYMYARTLDRLDLMKAVTR